MYAKYEYNASATQANVLADIVKIFTGETNVNNLSASCNKTLTTITATIPAGWTVFDAAASATSQVIRASYVDSGSSYKYVELKATSTSSFDVFGYESWNATTHVGTNKTGNTSSPQPWTTSTNGRFLLFASARFLAVVGEYSTTYGSGSYKGMTVVAEFSREQPWNDGTYPSFALILSGECFGGSKSVFYPRIKDVNNYDLLTTAAVSYLTTIGTAYNGWTSAGQHPSGVSTKVLDNSGNRFIPMFPVYLFESSLYSSPPGEISSICDIWIPPREMLGHLESTTQSGNTYIATTAYAYSSYTVRFLFRKG